MAKEAKMSKYRYRHHTNVEEVVHGSTMSHRERLAYVREMDCEALMEAGEYENLLLKAMDRRDALFSKTIRRRARFERLNDLVVLMCDCLCESGFVKVGGAMWLGGNGYYRPVYMRYVWDCVYRCLLFIGVGALDAMKVAEPSIRAMDDMTASIRRDVIRFRNCFYVFGEGIRDVLDSGVCIYGVDWDYVKGTKCPLFDRFLLKVLPDVNDRMCIQEFFGMAFVDRSKISIEKFLMMIGNGANGKSVLLNIVSAVIGNSYISHLDPSQLRDYKQISAMDGKRFNIASDVKSSAVLSSAMKTLISGEKVEAWKMYEGNKNIYCPPLVFSMNEMPRTEDKTNGMIRRMLPVFFSVSIPEQEQDKSLAAKIIENELSAVFDWMVEGRNRLLANGGVFTQSIKSIAMSGDIVRNSVPILQLLEKAGLSKEPKWEGQEHVMYRAKEIVAMFDLELSTSAAKVARDLRDSGFRTKTVDGRTFYIFFKDENS